MDTAKSIRVALAKAGISQMELAVKAGTSGAYISHLANGRAHLQGKLLVRISEAFGLKVSEFIALGED